MKTEKITDGRKDFPIFRFLLPLFGPNADFTLPLPLFPFSVFFS